MTNSNQPLVQALVEYKEGGSVSFHVPGHKNGILSSLPKELLGALQFDATELEGLDDLHEPSGVLKDSQLKLGELYGSDQSFFLVNGSTVGNLAMVYATCNAGDTVIVQRNAHKSIFNAIELTGADAVFIAPTWDSNTRTAGTVKATQIRKALKLYPKTKAVILTYPTYYGVTGLEMEEIVNICHIERIPVLVDEAHGAHFVVGQPFPCSALDLGADVVVHSAHKTLPAMTMASFLHVKSSLVNPEQIAYYLRMLQSSSPSYLLLASLDDARNYAETYNEEDKFAFMEQRNHFIKRLKEIPLLQTIETDDPLKLIIRAKGYSGFELQKNLNVAGIYSELADLDQVLFVLPLLKVGYDYSFGKISENIELAFERLDEAMKVTSIPEPVMMHEDIARLYYKANILKQLETEWVSYEETEGAVAAGSIIPYPPGIPLLLGGELVTAAHILLLTKLLTSGARLQGTIRLHEKQILVVKKGVEE